MNYMDGQEVHLDDRVRFLDMDRRVVITETSSLDPDRYGLPDPDVYALMLELDSGALVGLLWPESDEHLEFIARGGNPSGNSGSAAR